MKKPQHIHFVGIKGVGMAPLAILAKEAGIIVSGSDIADSFITDAILQENGIAPFVGFDASHIGDADLVITTGAHGGFDNPEVVTAKEKHIPVLTQGEAVGEFMKGEVFDLSDLQGISVAGTHGKTTTSAMVATILQEAGQDPSWVIGTSRVFPLGAAGHFGKSGKYFVAEADEYANEPMYDKTPKFFFQHPSIAVITNVEHDHPDVYPTIEDTYKAFASFANQVSEEGVLVCCGDDEGVKSISKNFSGKIITYGFSEENIYRIISVEKSGSTTTWNVIGKGDEVVLSLHIPGEHNVLNATAAYLVAKQFGLSDEEIAAGLTSFKGTKRRMEYIGQLPSGALLYDDYAHHPTEIKKTLSAFKEKYPDKKIVCIFQPHTYSRTKLLFDQFIDSLSLADEIILTDIYSSKREVFDPSVSSSMLVEKLKKERPTELAPTLSDVIKYVNQHHFRKEVVVVTMGAGDVYQVANTLLQGK